jgi:hypothetical protein
MHFVQQRCQGIAREKVGREVGFRKEKVKKQVPCFHKFEAGDYCSKCGARKKSSGLGYEPGTVVVEEEISVLCSHWGETGDYCSQCGDKLSRPF